MDYSISEKGVKKNSVIKTNNLVFFNIRTLL